MVSEPSDSPASSTGTRRRASRGLALPETLAAAAVVGVALCLLLVVGDRSRRLAGLNESVSNLRQIGAATDSYTQHNQGRIPTLSWNRVTFGTTQFADLQGPYSDDISASAAQAVDIMRRLGGGDASTMPRVNNWVAYILHSHLALADFIGVDAPSPWFLSPGDESRRGWLASSALPIPGDPNSYRWRFSSSYDISAAFFNPDIGRARRTATLPELPTLFQTSAFNEWSMFRPGTWTQPWLGLRRAEEVAFPSQKAHQYEDVQRFFGPRDAYFMYPEARVPVLMADGSASVRRTGDANLSFRPDMPTREPTTVVQYTTATMPPGWTLYPPPLNNPNGDALDARYRWTRSGLRGRDFDGPAVPWVD